MDCELVLELRMCGDGLEKGFKMEVTTEALGRVDDRAKEGIKNLDLRLSMVEDRQAEAARLQAQDMREIREKMDGQSRRIETFTEQQAVLMKTRHESEVSLAALTEKVQEIYSGIKPLAKSVVHISDLLEKMNMPEMKNNLEKLEERFECEDESRKDYEEKIQGKLDKLMWWIIGGMGAILMSVMGLIISKFV